MRQVVPAEFLQTFCFQGSGIWSYCERSEFVTYTPPPKDAPYLQTLLRIVRQGATRWRHPTESRIYEWDGRHGELEVYDAQGWHLGAADPQTGKFVKGPRKGRRIDV